MPELTVNGLRFHLRDEGSGPVVMLLHGVPDTGEVWRRQVPALTAAGFRLLVPDMRGRGRTERPPEVSDCSVRTAATDVTAILDELGSSGRTAWAADFGAAVAWLVGSIFSQRVGRLVALSVGFLPIERLLAPPLRLQSVQAPTLGMWSTGERYLTEKAMVASESRVTGGWRYERVENASHWLQLDQPERVNALLLEFLGEPGSEAR